MGFTATGVGVTPDPCGNGTFGAWIKQGQPSEYMGETGNAGTTAGAFYQISEARIGTIGQLVNATLNGRAVPWIWSIIEFDTKGNPTYSDLSSFPTFSIYKNGTQVQLVHQGSAMNFIQTAPLNVDAWSPIP